MILAGSAIAATAKSMAPATLSKFLQMDTCPDGLTDKVGNVIAAIGEPGRIVRLWTCRKTHIWIIPDMVGTVISPIENAILHVHPVVNVTEEDK